MHEFHPDQSGDEPATGPPQSSRGRFRRGGPLFVVAIVVAALVLVGGGAAAVLLLANSGDDEGAAEEPTARTVKEPAQPRTLAAGLSALTEPTEAWTVTAEGLMPGGSFDYLRYWEGSDGPEVLAFPAAVVVHLTDGASYQLAALDPDGGSVLWKRDPAGDGPNCFSVAQSTRLLCRVTGDESGAGTYDLIDPETGETLGTFAAPSGDENVASDRDAIYLGTRSPDVGAEDYENHSIQLAKLSADDLTEQWVIQGEDPGPNKDEGNDFDAGIFVATDSGTVRVSYGYLDWSFSAKNGDRTGLSDAYADGYMVSDDGYRINEDYVDDLPVTTVADADGNTILTADGSWWNPFDYSGDVIRSGRLGVGDSLYDLSSGEPAWTHDGLTPHDSEGYPTPVEVRWSPTGNQVILTDGSDPEAVSGRLLDAATGDVIWDRVTIAFHDPASWTGDGVLTVHGGDLEALPRSPRDGTGDGPSMWSTSVAELASGAEDERDYALAATDRTVVVVGDAGVRGYHGFAATDSAPGAQAGDDTDDDTQKGSDNQEGGTEYVTVCGSEPELTPVESAPANGGITITFEVHAVCPDGGWLNSTGQVVTLTGSNAALYGSATFDFSSAPHWLPGPDEDGPDGDPVTVKLTFPYDTVYATVDELADGIETDVVVVECETESGAEHGTIPADATLGADPLTPVTAQGPSTTDPDDAALAAIRRIAAHDADALAALEGRWVPQLSSKINGTTDDGIVYDHQAILAEHLRLQARYPGALLVNSDDYKSFLVPGYWVTLVADPSANWRPALSWCPEHGFDKDHCYAKRILRDGPPDGATHHLEELQ